jgi:hypothetical protein
VQCRDDLGDPLVIAPIAVRHPDRALLDLPPPACAGVGLNRDPVRHTVQPARQRTLDRPDRVSLAHQDQERRLKRVLGIIRIAENLPANGQHHRPVALHECLERRCVTPGRIPLQKVRIR